MHSDSLLETARNLGIASQFVDNNGDVHKASSDALAALIEAASPHVDSATADTTTSHTNIGSQVLRLGEPVEITLAELSGCGPLSSPVDALARTQIYQWEIKSEGGDVHAGQCTALPESCRNSSDESHSGIAGQEKTLQVPCLVFDLPVGLACGYHWLTLTGDTPDSKPVFHINLIVVPACAWSGLLEQRTCGVSLQLYALCSERNWGIGDFTDLESFCSLASDAGIDVIGLNPLHALYSAHPSRCSPYSPTSREFLNPLYIDVDRVAGTDQCSSLNELYQERQFQQSLTVVRKSPTVRYADISSLKLRALWLIYKELFAEDVGVATSAAGHNFDRFKVFEQTASHSLRLHARFQAFDEYFSKQQLCDNWLQWPIEYRDATSAASDALADTLSDRIRFHVFLQWVASEQLAAVTRHCSDLGMRYGLYMDLAVGVDRHAGDVWAFPELHAQGVHIGAPPDALGPQGQDWSLTPYNPGSLQRVGYVPFVEMLRANMRHCGMLRIDHVMGLLRQYWCVPQSNTQLNTQFGTKLAKSGSEVAQANGSYIEFPFDDLLGIVALESQRNQCLIVGEDLGTVPDGFRQALCAQNILGYRVLYFERERDHSFISPSKYTLHSLATASTHDLPPLAGFYQGLDLALRDSLGHFENAEAKQQAFDQRKDVIQHLKNAFVAAGLSQAKLAEVNSNSQTVDQNADGIDPVIHDFVNQVHRLLCDAASHIVMFQIEDLLLQTQMMNMPGTIEEHPNWQRRLSYDIELIKTQLGAVSKLRATYAQSEDLNSIVSKND